MIANGERTTGETGDSERTMSRPPFAHHTLVNPHACSPDDRQERQNERGRERERVVVHVLHQEAARDCVREIEGQVMQHLFEGEDRGSKQHALS